MSRHGILTAIFLMILPIGLAHSEIHWMQDTDEAQSYSYSVINNNGTFYYSPTGVIQSNGEPDYKTSSDPYNSVAENKFTEFGYNIDEEILMHAMAMGPDQDGEGNPVNPTHGLKVQAFAQIIPKSLDQRHGIADALQQVASWSTRWFTLDQTSLYELKAELEGDLLFNAFNSSDFSDEYYATQELSAKVTLSARVVTDTGEPLITDVFTSQVTMEDPISTTLTLHPTDDEGRHITYELIISINLASEINNMRWGGEELTILGPIKGTFNIGTPENPMALTATVTKATTDDSGDNSQVSDEDTTTNTSNANNAGGGGGGGCFIDVSGFHHKQ